jgi:DNA modification methylase
MKTENRPLSKIKPYKGNPRKITDAAVEKVAASIREFGFQQPIVLDKDGVIIVGHTRYLAAKSLGLDSAPCVVAVDLTAKQARAYRIADNRTGEQAKWDDDLLSFEIKGLEDFDLGLTGFDPAEINKLLTGTGGDEDDVPEPDSTSVVTSPSDIWLLGRHRLICGDSTDAGTVAKCLNGVVPHLMVTDPPYGVEYDATWRGKAGHATMGKNRTGIVENDTRADWRDAWALFPGAIAYVWHGGLQSPVVAESLTACGFTLRSQIIWNKSVMVMGRGDYHWKHEPCWYAVKDAGHWVGDRKQTTVWDFASPLHIMGGSKEEKTPHPTQKPVECMKRPIENNSSPGQAVYEPFSGSGTTIIAAEMTGRSCHAIEINPAYVDVAVARWQNFTGRKAIRESDGRTFDEAKTDGEKAA